MRYRPIEWFDLQTREIKYGIQTSDKLFRWLNTMVDGKAVIYETKEERDKMIKNLRYHDVA